MSKQRIIWMDIGKGIAIICVVLGHCIAGLDSPLKQAIFSFHMPLFFIYAGITFRAKGAKEVLSASSKRLLVPYLLLFSVTALVTVLNAESLSPDVFGNLGLELLFASAVTVQPWGFPAAGMIWFLMVLFLSRVLVNGMVGLFQKWKAPLPAQIIGMVVFAGLGILAGRFAYLPFSFDLVPLACLFMFAGYAVKEHGSLERATSWPVVGISVVIWVISMRFCWFSMGDRMFDLAPRAVAGAFAGTIIISKISQLIERFIPVFNDYLAFMGRNSLPVFALHHIESHLIDWGLLPLVVASGDAWYVVFIARFVLISICMAVFMAMPISRKE